MRSLAIQAESGEPFKTDRDLRTGIHRQEKRSSGCAEPRVPRQDHPTILDVAHADPQARGRLRRASADQTRINCLYLQRRASVDTTLVRDKRPSTTSQPQTCRLQGAKLRAPRRRRWQVSVVAGREGRPLAKKGVCQERLSQIVSVTTQTSGHLEEGLELQAPIAESLGG